MPLKIEKMFVLIILKFYYTFKVLFLLQIYKSILFITRKISFFFFQDLYFLSILAIFVALFTIYTLFI